MLNKKMIISIVIALVVILIIFIFLFIYSANKINPEGKAQDNVEQNVLQK
jgi:heme/copper-type cytochrome/quinol oxidase subunit 2